MNVKYIIIDEFQEAYQIDKLTDNIMEAHKDGILFIYKFCSDDNSIKELINNKWDNVRQWVPYDENVID